MRRGTFPRMVWRPLLHQTKRELAASCVVARSMEWALTRLTEARHWAQYAARQGATASSFTKFVTAIASFKKGHRVTEDCKHADLIQMRKSGLELLEELEQVTSAWIKFWSEASVRQEEEDQHFLQLEELQLEEAGLRVSTKLDEWEAAARESVEMALKRDAIAARTAWNEWVHAALDGGAKKAHAFSKLPVPDPVQQIHSVKEVSRIANTSVLAAEKQKLQQLWMSRDSRCAHSIPLAHRACMLALAPDVIRRAARDFSTHTAASTDGFSMRHFALLSDSALALVAQLFTCMEALGTLPQQLRFVLVVLFPKATAGLRPIGVFCALYRLWAKCRTVSAQAWEDLHPRPYFAASKGRAVTDPVWRHAAAVECRAASEQETVSVWRDFAQFYERKEHQILERNAFTFHFPLPVLRVSLAAYQMQRVLVLHGEVTPTGYPTRGVVAGCAIATYLVKLYCLPVLDKVVKLHPRVSLDIFIDDSHQSVQGTPREAERLIVAAGRTLTSEAQKNLRVRFAEKKTAVVSSHRKLALNVARRLGLQAEAVKTQTVGLGVDVSAGKTRNATAAKRRKRMRETFRRRARLRALTRRAGSAAQKVFKCGMHPAAMYGDEVSGVSDGEWRKLQRLASAAHSPLTAGRSLSALWLWYEDPTTPSLIAPILRWAKEVWLSATHPRQETGEHGQFLRLFSLPALRSGNAENCNAWSAGGK